MRMYQRQLRRRCTKDSFRTQYEYYDLLVMPSVLISALGAFIFLMNRMFQLYMDQFMIVFKDFSLIYSRSREEHETYLRIASLGTPLVCKALLAQVLKVWGSIPGPCYIKSRIHSGSSQGWASAVMGVSYYSHKDLEFFEICQILQEVHMWFFFFGRSSHAVDKEERFVWTNACEQTF